MASRFAVPLFCTVLSVCLNLILSEAGLISGGTSAVFDVSIQLIFVAFGGAVGVSLSHGTSTRARPDWAVIYCFTGLCLVLGCMGLSNQGQWPWVTEAQEWLRVWIPDIIGAGTLGATIWRLSF